VVSAPDVLVIEDDRILGGAVVQRLKLEGFAASWAQTCEQALLKVKASRPDFVLADIRLPDGSGEDLYRKVLPFLGDTPIVFVTAFGEIDQAVRLVRAGADDYLTKPFDVDALVAHIRRRISDRAPQAGAPEESFALSPATEAIAGALRRAADSDLSVLLVGETGVGKEVAARFVHRHSRRASEPFIAVNCGAVPHDLMESEFFGHERGAFTGALASHVGFLEEAAAGTLFLDEIGELDRKLQVSLLRVLQDHSFRPVGARKEKRFHGRIVAATNADLRARIAAKEFREDLYFRLAVIELEIPPLRERVVEIEPLARRFLASSAERLGRGFLDFTDGAVRALRAHAWPGNVRELRNRVERAVALGVDQSIDIADLFPETRLADADAGDLKQARHRAELQEIELALAKSKGKVGEAARRLGISRTTLWKRTRKER
jgi:DNA-binding NtrC family response regulator